MARRFKIDTHPDLVCWPLPRDTMRALHNYVDDIHRCGDIDIISVGNINYETWLPTGFPGIIYIPCGIAIIGLVQ